MVAAYLRRRFETQHHELHPIIGIQASDPGGRVATRGVPSNRTRLADITRATLAGNGEAQRLNSSRTTLFAPVLKTICGRSTKFGHPDWSHGNADVGS